MPQIGDRKTKDGVTGEWDGQTWREVTADQNPSKGTGSGGASVPLGVAGSPALVRILDAAANSPVVPQVGSTMGRIIGGVAPMVGGAMEGGLPGALKQLPFASLGAWKGSTPGYFTAKLGQQLLRPIAKGVSAVSPYTQALSTLGGASGVGDLAQMAEPNRRDIGFMGIGPSQNVPGQQPALLNLLWQKLQRIWQ